MVDPFDRELFVTHTIGNPMLTHADIQSALALGSVSFDALQRLYLRLPSTRCECESPGICCRFMPEMTLLEALQWIDVLSGMPEDRRVTLMRRFVLFYLVTPLQQPGCPFLEEGGCSIYLQRPFACRAYGLWSATIGKAKTRQHRDGKKALIHKWRDLGIQVSAGAVAFEMDYCTRVYGDADPPLTDGAIMAVLSEVYALDEPLGHWRDVFEEYYHSDFSYLLMATLFGARKSVLAKIAVIKEIAEMGTERRLQKFVSQVGDRAPVEVFDKSGG